MDMKHKAYQIYHMPLDDQRKLNLLKDLLVDCYNEMEAQDQNMRPGLTHNVAEGYRLAKNYIRRLDRSQV